MKKLLILSFLFSFTLNTYSQIEFKIDRLSKKLVKFSIEDTTRLEMWKYYRFVVKTNIKKEDEVYFSFDKNNFIYDGYIFNKSFDYHEFGFMLMKNGKQIGDQYIIQLKGTKFIVKIDDKVITRYKANKVYPNSKISIELASDNIPAEKLEVKTPILVYWMQNGKYVKKMNIIDNKAILDLNQENELIGAIDAAAKSNILIIALPQVYIGTTELLAREQQARMYIVQYVK